MFVQVKCDPSLTVGSVVSYSSTDSRWNSASSSSAFIGVLSSAPDSEGWANVQFAGISYALASRDIPDEGGFCEIENGRVYAVSSGGVGVVAPKDKNSATRVAGDLVMIHVR
jgi:hypothetical protein